MKYFLDKVDLWVIIVLIKNTNKKYWILEMRTTKVSIKDVARIAEVSIGTVSRVFNQNSTVDLELRNKVCRVSREIGFIPKVNTESVVLITRTDNVADPVEYVSVMTSLLSHHLMQQKISVRISDLSDLTTIYDPQIVGVIAIVSSSELPQLAKIPNLPVVTLTQPMLDCGFHSIRADHIQQGRLAADHLIEKGHKKIGFLGVDPNDWSCKERQKGYCNALANAGLKYDESSIQFAKGQQLYDIVSRWVKNGITGILNFNFEHPLELMHILSNVLQIKIGQDISLIGLEDLPVYQYLSPPQTAIKQPLQELAERAVATLMARGNQNIETPLPCPVDISFSSELIERDSVVCLND